MDGVLAVVAAAVVAGWVTTAIERFPITHLEDSEEIFEIQGKPQKMQRKS